MISKVNHLIGVSYKMFIALALMCVYSTAGAHTGLKTSNPADGSTLSKAPEQMNLTFTAAVSLVRFNLTDSSGKQL